MISRVVQWDLLTPFFRQAQMEISRYFASKWKSFERWVLFSFNVFQITPTDYLQLKQVILSLIELRTVCVQFIY